MNLFDPSAWPFVAAAALIGVGLGVPLGRWLAGSAGRWKLKESEVELAHQRKVSDDQQHKRAELQERVIRLTAEVEVRDRKVAAAARLLERARSENAELTSQRNDCRTKLAGRGQTISSLEADLGERQTEAERLRQAVEEVEQKYIVLNDRFERLEGEKQQADGLFASTQHKLTLARRGGRRLRKQIKALGTQIEGVLRQDGRVWERPYAEPRPRFVPLATRKTPVISVLNLKGGVGKTTVTANLGAALARSGSRVLMIDLDYQRSLSTLCLDGPTRGQIHQQQRSFQHFLLSPGRDAKTLLGCATRLEWGDGLDCSVVVNTRSPAGTDSMEDVEMRLLAEWLVTPGLPDVRLHLRHALHAPAVSGGFDFVLLDCPPRLTTATMNALAASDYVLIPLLLDWTSAVAVPNLLQALKGMVTAGVLPDLAVLGILANRAAKSSGRLTHREAVVWKQHLPEPCSRVWGGPLHFCETVVWSSPKIAAAADKAADPEAEPGAAVAALTDPPTRENFAALAAELLKEIPHACRRAAAVPS
jgi:cellulose biosynthesis protein BcsQ